MSENGMPGPPVGGEAADGPPRQPRRLAVFIDAENLLIGARDAGFPQPLDYMMSHIKSLGLVAVARAYGDWNRYPCAQALRQFWSNVIEMQMLVTNEKGKNTADIQLALDALELVLEPTAPDTLVLACADRDFVPLVQKAKRYGRTVFGIGVRGSVSRELAAACDRFFMLDDIIPDRPAHDGDRAEPLPRPQPLGAPAVPPPRREAEPVVAAPTPAPQMDRATAFRLLCRAVETLRADGLTPYGARCCEWMRNQSSEFDYRALGFEQFRDFALEAEREGQVRVLLSSVSDFQIDLAQADEGPVDELSFETPEQACESYRRILLEDKRVPLAPWRVRRDLVQYLWDWLASEPLGASIVAMNEQLKAYGRSQGHGLPDRAYDKIVHTLNIAKCFQDQGYRCYCQDLYYTKLRPAVEVDTALELMNAVYVQGILWERAAVDIDDDGFAMLLYDDEYEPHVDSVARLLDRLAPHARPMA